MMSSGDLNVKKIIKYANLSVDYIYRVIMSDTIRLEQFWKTLMKNLLTCVSWEWHLSNWKHRHCLYFSPFESHQKFNYFQDQLQKYQELIPKTNGTKILIPHFCHFNVCVINVCVIFVTLMCFTDWLDLNGTFT